MWAAWIEQENFLEQKVFGREEWESWDVWWSGTEKMMWIILVGVLALGIRKTNWERRAKAELEERRGGVGERVVVERQEGSWRFQSS